MSKVRLWILLCMWIFSTIPAFSQTDTLIRHGFSDYSEAADTLFARLMNKKLKSVVEFTVSESYFVAETRKHDTIVPLQMVHGQYLAYWSKVERSFKKIHKKLRKQRITSRKAVFDTVLIYRNSGTNNVMRTELYFYQKKYKAWVKFQLWNVNGLWYFTGKMQLIEEKTKK